MAVAFGLALIFLALTRTQVGRDELRKEIERQFADQLQGRIEIGQLKGNLLNDLYASQVRIFDPFGTVVLQADSVVMRPRWRDLFRRTVSVGSVTLYRPVVNLVRQESGSWTIADAFRPRIASGRGPSSWTLNSSDIRIVDGVFETSRLGPAPAPVANGQVFDFTNTRLQDIDAAATVEWGPHFKLVEVQRLSGDWSSLGLPLDLVQGQIVLEKDRLEVNQLEVRAGATTLGLSGTIDSLRALRSETPERVTVQLNVQPSRIHSKDVRHFAPSLPLGDVIEVEGRVYGPLSALNVDRLRVERGQSRLLANGSLSLLPDSIRFDVRLHPSTLTARDIAAVLPAARLPDLQHLGVLHFELSSEGAVSLSEKGSDAIRRLASSFNVRGTAGSAEGRIIYAPNRSDVAYSADIRLEEVDLGRIMRKGSLQSRLNGAIVVAGAGLPADDLNGRMHVNLSPSFFSGHWIDTLSITADAQDGVVATRSYYAGSDGVLFATGDIDMSGNIPAYSFNITGRQIDLGPLLRTDSIDTALNGSAVISGHGLSVEDLGGRFEIALDSSLVRYGDLEHVIPPVWNMLEIVHPSTGDPLLLLSGDVATVRFNGDVALDPLLALTRLWGTEALRMIDREFDKPLRGPQTDLAAELDSIRISLETAVAANESALLRSEARTSLERAGFEEGLSTTMQVELHRPDLLAALLPMLPPFEANLRSTLRFYGDADTLTVSGSVFADSIGIGSVRTGAFRTTLDLAASLNAPLDESLVLTLDASTDTVHVSGFTTAHPSLSVHYRQRSGELSFTTRGSRSTGPMQLAAALDLLPDRNRLTLFNLLLSAGSYQWTNTDDYPIDLYSDAVVIPGLTLQSWTSDSGPAQRVYIHGTLSGSPSDKLSADIRNISLRQISEALKMKHPIAGLVHGELDLTGGLTRPELTGRIDVPVFVFDNRVLGTLNLTSQYLPGSPDVALYVNLEPVASLQYAINQQAEELLGGRGLVAKENTVHLGGTFRLPRLRNGLFTEDSGELDLKLDASRVDLFFFELLFPSELANVEGYATARGSITGSFSDPVPDIQAEVRDARFNVPEFRLTYTAEGPVSIDEEGIHIHGARVGDPTGGTAVLTGGILFNDYRYFSFDVQGELDELQIMNVMQSQELPFYGRIWTSGTARLTGPVYSAMLRSTNAIASARSEVFIPLVETDVSVDPGFIVFADSTGKVPDLQQISRRKNLLSRRPTGERTFIDGLEMDLNIFAQSGSTVHLVIDPLLGDVINAVGSGRIQLQLLEGEFSTFGTLNVTSGDYLFTAGDVFMRRFLIDNGTITWDGDPINAQMNIQASYRTRASTQGIEDPARTVPLIVRLGLTGRVSTPEIGLSLAIDRRDRDLIGNVSGMEARLNQPDKATEYATSVLLTNSFLLTTSDQGSFANNTARDGTSQFAFTSLSQLVTSQINRYLSQAIPNLDVNFGLQTNRVQDLDISYGVAVRLLDERLVIRGQGVYLSEENAERLRGEFVVEVRLNPNVSVEVFYRKEGDQISDATATNTTGAGLSYQTQFSTWRRLTRKLFGWIRPDDTGHENTAEDERNETGTGLPDTTASTE